MRGPLSRLLDRLFFALDSFFLKVCSKFHNRSNVNLLPRYALEMEILSIRPDTHTLNAKNVAYLLKWKGSSFFNGLNVVKRNVKMQKVLHTSCVLVCSVYQLIQKLMILTIP